MKFLDRMNAKYNNVELDENNLEEYQEEAILFLKKNPKSALFIDTGLGKTAICLKLIRDLVDLDLVKKILIIAPLKVANQTWGDEIEKWRFSAPIPYKLLRNDDITKALSSIGRISKSIVLSDADNRKIARKVKSKLTKAIKENPHMTEERQKVLEQGLFNSVEIEYRKHLTSINKQAESLVQLKAKDKENPTIINIINQEMIEWLVDAWADEWPYDCVIYDESDAIKDATTKRWKALDSIKHLTVRFHQLTATPAAEDYLGLFAQIKLLDGGKRLGRTMKEYKERYFNVSPYNYKITMKDGAEEDITRVISDITLVMKQEDYLKDVPPYVITNVTYDLSEEARELYTNMQKGGVVTVGNTIIVAEQAVSVIQKMMQISAGFIYDTEETINDFGSFSTTRKIYHIHDDKIKALRELVNSYPNDNFLISYYHQGSLEKLQKHFPEAVKMDRKGTQKSEWNEGKIKMLLMHPKSGSHGLNLQKGGRIVINYDVYFSYGQFYQFLRRLARRGQNHSQVLVFNLLASGTYDMVVERGCWVDKRNKQNIFFDLIKSLKFKKKGV